MDSLPGWAQLVLILALIVSVSLLPTILAALWEKRLVWPYVPVDEKGDPGKPESADADEDLFRAELVPRHPKVRLPSHYTLQKTDAVRHEGFLPHGTCVDGRGRLYDVRYDFWLSDDALVLAVIECGTVAKIPVQNTSLYTSLSDGGMLATIESQAASEFDMSGMTEEKLISGVPFPKYLERHRGRSTDLWESPVPFSTADPLGDLRAFRKRKTDRLYEHGHVNYLDSTRSAWRYSIKGALSVALRTYSQGMRRVFWPDR